MSTGVKGIILDFDMTLFDTRADEDIRKGKRGKDINWDEVFAVIPQYRLYDGWKEVFQYAKLNGIKVAIVSTAKGELIKRTLNYFEIECDAVVGWQLYVRKPSGKLVDMALNKIGVRKSEVISIGDSIVDKEMSLNGGVRFIGAIWDSEDVNELKSGPHISSPIELLSVIK